MTDERKESDKNGEALAAQRFAMLADIAKELAGEVLFPTCFDAVLRLRKEMQNPNIALSRVAQIVQLEPLIAAKLVRLANSAAYATLEPARTLSSAINRLGLDVVRATAMSVAMGEILHAKEMVAFSALAQSLWEHSIVSAAATRLLAKKNGKINAEEAMLAGLVHDLGAFYMLYRGARYPELRERPDTLRYIVQQWHESIGVTLLETLGLPKEIAQASADHDQFRSVPDIPKTLSDIVYIGNMLAGGCHAWLHHDRDTPMEAEVQSFHEKYASLLPEIESLAKEMQGALS